MSPGKNNDGSEKEDTMASTLTFRSINKNQLRWHPELAGDVREWLNLDGCMENGYKYELLLAASMEMGDNIVGPEKGDWPLVDCHVTNPEGETHRVAAAFPIKELSYEEPWGVKIGENSLTGSLTPEGEPAGYRVKVALDDIGIDITAKAVALGVKFVEDDHGYMFHDPATNLAIGYWPLITRAEIEGTLTFHGQAMPVKGLGWCERQVGNLGFAGWLSKWLWGHGWAGDYTALWNTTASTAVTQYRHFSPMVVWKGGDIILSTHNVALRAERYEIDPEIGMPYPTIETLRATEGNVEVSAMILPGTILERDLMTKNPGTSPEKPGCYFRHYSDFDMEIRRLDRVEQVRGTCIRESGWIEQLFPVPGRS
jgi:hypothetical protein